MERNSTACAMEWSIELEKALRSKKPGRSIEAIMQVGQRIQQWSREPEPTMAMCNVFGLVPGEDNLFANAILLRLADAFRLGDIDTRVSVVHVFLSELRNRKKEKERKPYKGILSKARVHNHLELLERVKSVFDTGDVESRALALVLFGCWADFANNSAHVRYLILSSMVSSDMMEVKASLFAAGCFCELAADFAPVVLEMLYNVVTSSEMLLKVRLVGVRVFAKMGCSYDVASKAYKAGLKLLLESSEEDFVVAMLFSLSKLAYKSTLLLSDYVNLLLSFLGQEKTLRQQATALRCLHFIFVRKGCYFPVGMHAIKLLFTAMTGTNRPSTVQCDALQIIHKMLLYQLADPSHDGKLMTTAGNMLEFIHPLATIENSTQSHARSKSFLALCMLADVSTKLRGRADVGTDTDFSLSLSSQIISIILDKLLFLVKPLLDICQTDAKVFQEVKGLLSLVQFLVREIPDLGISVLDKTGFLVKYLVGICNETMGTGQACLAVDKVVSIRGKMNIDIILKFLYDIHKFSVLCIENLNETGSISKEILSKVQMLVEHVHQCSLFDHYAHIMYSILLHSHIIWGLINKNRETSKLDGDSDNSICNLLLEHEIFSLDCAKKMLIENDSWLAYRAGTSAACEGAWVTASFIFEQLMGKVQSESCISWLKSLALFAQSESKFQMFLLPKLGSIFVDWSQKKEFPVAIFRNDFDEIAQCAINNSNHAEVLARACHGLCSSKQALGPAMKLCKSFCFQMWFLDLRVKVLGTLVDVLKVLGTAPLRYGDIGNKRQLEKSTMVECINSLQHITEQSFKLRRLAEEFDLMVMSFIGMESRSSKIISALALSCSVLAFTAGFALLIPNLLTGEILTTCSLENSSNWLIQDLAGRLWCTDQEIISNLYLLLKVDRQPVDCFHFQPRSQILNRGTEVRDILHVCRDAVSGIVALQNEAKGVKNEESLSQAAMNGLHILLSTIIKWMGIPFRVPKYFFKIRPSVGAELFAFSADTKNQNEIFVLPGFHLSLNLCLQLKNVPADSRFHATKMYCILYSSASFQETRPSGAAKEHMPMAYLASETNAMVQMNKELLHYATGCTKKMVNGRRNVKFNKGTVCTFASFELNDAGQGFSNCLLDVSNFPVGSYRIKWHSCCIDKQGSYWSLLPLNSEPVFNVQNPSVIARH